MRIVMRSAAAIRRAQGLYPGESFPLSQENPTDRPLDIDWWVTNPQNESSRSERHFGALTLYLELARASRIDLPAFTFPARFDFDDGSMRPDKGVIKVFLDEGLVIGRMMLAQLVFDVTDAGRAYLETHSR
jgi:hypothetical protein